ncbi:hypothetical protein [Calothrix sp. 336/3]|uniref:hypothetical protein n=1 Tax=Calothrix sp. 336/3 TaxID=1337936 RepID=UPI0004E430F0|nr:hypothetical protein [Calothrix sp. 336/3]AKG23293.1 hypothetical protein IJ00_20215 [Calothrix sp. 336/3]
MENSQSWYIVKQPSGNCEIVTIRDIPENQDTEKPEKIEKWGPFPSQGEAIARRIGLIRSGKCQPV